jgi:hypothetical protein
MIPPSRASSPIPLAVTLAASVMASVVASVMASVMGGALAGCASSSLGPLDASGELHERPHRHPDGVAIDPISAPPPARDRADASEGLVTLRTPLGADRAVALVADLFRRVVLEDGEGLDGLFTRDAVSVSPAAASNGNGQPPSALLLWQGRFRKLDYTKLAGEPIYREAELQIFRGDDSVEALPHPAVHAEALGDNDVVVRVPILTTRIGAERLFGDDMVLWMRRDGDRFRIYRVFEDFSLN